MKPLDRLPEPLLASPGAAERRRSDLARLANDGWDVLVVGGGIVGAGVLLDAASRGLRVALVEQDDLAAGTSSRSSRLIHGGLRYIEQFDFRLVREALSERRRLLRLAPHLVRLEPFLFPIYGPVPALGRAFYGAGLAVYDVLGAARDGGRARHLGRGAVLDRAPVLRPSGLRGGIVYHDGVVDDARLVLAVVRAAVERGAVALTRAHAGGLLVDQAGSARGVRVLDRLSGTELEVAAGRIIDATGVWASNRDSPFERGAIRLTPSRGSHVIVPRHRIAVSTGLTIRTKGRVVFLVPWPGHWIIGTTDIPDNGAVDRPVPTSAELEELLGVVNGTLDVNLRPHDLVGAYAGLRPLVAGARSSTMRTSREHHVAVDPSGVVRVSGGKFTTYRVMARDAVDAALDGDARRRPSATDDLPLGGPADAATLSSLAEQLARRFALPPTLAERVVGRHGADAQRLVELGSLTGQLGVLGPGVDALEAEVGWAVREEFALSLDDVVARRLRLATTLSDRGRAIAPRVAELVGAELGWDERRRRAEVAAYLASAHREYDVPGAGADETARAAPVELEAIEGRPSRTHPRASR